jgi:uncharacterized alkaline shock family protein YloU
MSIEACRAPQEDVVRVSLDPVPGRSMVTRRAIRDLVRNATLGVYGVSGFAARGPVNRLLERLGLASPGLRLDVDGRKLTIDLRLNVAYGLPIAEVARQVDHSVRYVLQHALGREPDRISIHVRGLRYDVGSPPPGPATHHPGQPGSSDLAGSGTDVA